MMNQKQKLENKLQELENAISDALTMKRLSEAFVLMNLRNDVEEELQGL
ncbi:hypothetical protein [Vibrio gallicus]|nr:hypothetical protein [Vibrio gallicus]